MQEGTLVVAVGHPKDGGPSADQPIPTTFNPGAPTQAQARPIVMKRAGLVLASGPDGWHGENFQLPYWRAFAHDRAMRALLSVACLVALVTEARPAEACTCREPGPPCERFWKFGAVFAGKVVATRMTNGLSGPDREETTFEVSESFRGNLGPRIVVSTSRGGCSYNFEAGAEYFVYAHDTGNGYTTSACTGTSRLEAAAADLAYARNLPQRQLGVVEGTVELAVSEARQSHARWIPRGDVVVSVRGSSFSARTAKDGRYRLEVPAGTHTLDVTDPGARIQGGISPSVTLLNPAACARRDIIEVWDGRIRGRILDHTGKPAANIEVAAHAAAGTRQPWRLSARTDASGDYQLHEVQEGALVVVVGHPVDGGPSVDQPIPTTFYPGTPTQAQARPIVMKRAGLVTKIDFRLPAPLPVHTVSGLVTFEGAPVPDVYVRSNNHTWSHAGGAPTDAVGHYSFRELAGDITVELCRNDLNAAGQKTVCVRQKRRLTRDLVVDLELPL